MSSSPSSVVGANDNVCMSLEVVAKGQIKATLVCWFLGLGSLVAWNSMLTSADYYYALFPSYHPSRVIPIVYLPFALLTISALTYLAAKLDIRKRITIGYTIFFIACFMLIVVDIASLGRGGVVPFIGILAVVAAFGVADGFVQGGMVGELSSMSSTFMQAFCAGLGAAGALTSALRLVTKAMFEKHEHGLRKGTMLFLAISTFCELLCIILYAIYFPRLHVVRYYRSRATADIELPQLSNMKLLRQNIDLALSLLMIQGLTLSIFPGFIFENTGHHQLGSWYPLVLVTIFNASDLVSRYIPLFECLKLEGKKVLMVASLFRFLFIPAFYFTAKYGEQGWMILLTSLLGHTNGYLTVCIMTLAPKGYKGPEQNALGNILVMSLLIGVLMGISFDWLWSLMIT